MNTNDEKMKTLLHYLEKADEKDLPYLWKKYIAEIALVAYGTETEKGDAFISAGWPNIEIEDAAGLKDLEFHEKNELAERLQYGQTEALIPVIERERAAFIKMEYGRLAAVMGTEYWDGEKKEMGTFHQEGSELTDLVSKKQAEPYELSLRELAKLPKLDKVVERIGTTSYMAFYSMYPDDQKRIELLNSMFGKITKGKLCPSSEVKELFAGHDAYLDKLLVDHVRVIK